MVYWKIVFHEGSFFYLIVLISETQIVVYCSEKVLFLMEKFTSELLLVTYLAFVYGELIETCRDWFLYGTELGFCQCKHPNNILIDKLRRLWFEDMFTVLELAFLLPIWLPYTMVRTVVFILNLLWTLGLLTSIKVS